MKVKPIKQIDEAGCGPTVIEMTTQYFSQPKAIKEIYKLANFKSEDGMSDKEIADSLRKLGYNVKEKNNSTWADLIKNNIEKNIIIVAWMLKGYIGHVSIVDKVDKNYVYLADSEYGKIIKLQKIIFLRLWFGYDNVWYPKKTSDIQLRGMTIVNKK